MTDERFEQLVEVAFWLVWAGSVAFILTGLWNAVSMS